MISRGAVCKHLILLAIAGSLAALWPACGIVPLGEPTYRDPVPSGNIVAQGSFTSLTSKPVSGTAAIYSNSASGANVLRIEGISTPAESGLQLVVTTSNGALAMQNLRGQGGSQNYPLGSVAFGTVFQQVDVHSPSADVNYGKAVLTH